jgi:peptidyl-prolyl cis-trans isomerase SurA
MRKLFITCLISGLSLSYVDAQVLFTYGNQSVTKDEFVKVYTKNTKKPDMSEAALRDYLDLYSLFRMKVAEAEKQKVDTSEKIIKDLDGYRKQLAKNYLTDDEITKKLVREAYDRMKSDLRVSHILLNCPAGADTVPVYRRLDSIYNVINSGKATFEEMAKQFSDDKGSKEIGGDVGYFTALQTVYQFENVAYNTKVGKVSTPFRTQFGYHILKLTDKRANRGQVSVAQILFLSPKSRGEEGLKVAQMKADSVSQMLKSGVPFYELVKKYSDDKFTVNDSGKLKPFGTGKMALEFENAAFNLKKVGDISEPIKTEFGYHIIKLLGKTPVGAYDSLFVQLKKKVENDGRSTTAKEYYFNKIKAKHGFKEYPENVKEIVDKIITGVPDTGKMRGILRGADFQNATKPVFTLAGKTYLQSDFAKFLETLTRGRLSGPKTAIVNDGYGMYTTNVVTDFQEHRLEVENAEFAKLMKEYRDGILLFELMDKNVWGKASKDTPGLAAFFATKKGKYFWEPGFEGSIFTFKNKTALDTGIMLINKKLTDEAIIKELNTNANPDRVAIQRGHFEFNKYKEATLAELQANNQKVINMPNGMFKLVVAKKVFTDKSDKTLEEARGYVVAEYQDYLEKQWNEKMRSAYPLKVNESAFKGMVVSKGK